MKCPNCGTETQFVKCDSFSCSCPVCGGYSEAGGTKTDGLLTKNSLRVRSDSLKYEGDTIPPHQYDKSTHRIKPNEDFLKKYPEKANCYFTKEELKEAGYGKLNTKSVCNKDSAEHIGDPNKKIKEILK